MVGIYHHSHRLNAWFLIEFTTYVDLFHVVQLWRMLDLSGLEVVLSPVLAGSRCYQFDYHGGFHSHGATPA